ncbi:MAG: DUF5991 domain-containing protein [Oscillospiraceae bacterium]|nr:DUF5991 domain-containing protein [Oscillospiraceae bacterium]
MINKSKLWLICALLLLMPLASCGNSNADLTHWLGVYRFSEFIEGQAGSNIMMDYTIKIYEENNSYRAIISRLGWQTWEEIKASVVGDETSVDIIFDEYIQVNLSEQFEKGDILLSFQMNNSRLLTQWHEIYPINPDNQEIGEYFIKINDIPTESAEPTPDLWSDYTTANLQNPTKLCLIDINNDGAPELIHIFDYGSILAYYSNREIKELSSSMQWGEAHECGGYPIYQNKSTGQIMTVNIHSQLHLREFYDYTDGDYVLATSEMKFWVEWEPDPRSEEYPPWRTDKYSVNGAEVSEEEYHNSITALHNDPDWITLCPCNEELEFTLYP